MVLGFIPMSAHLSAQGTPAQEKKSCQLATKETLQMTATEEELSAAFVSSFRQYVNVDALVSVCG